MLIDENCGRTLQHDSSYDTPSWKFDEKTLDSISKIVACAIHQN